MSFGEFNMNDALKAREEEGFDEGRRQGQAEGERIGVEKGRAEGEKIGMQKMIELMKQKGFTPEQIALVSGGMDTIKSANDK